MGSASPFLFSLMCLLLFNCVLSWDETSNIDPSKNETPSKIPAIPNNTTTVSAPTQNSTAPTNATVVMPAPEDFVVSLLINKTVYLSWKEIDHHNASYQLFMAYGNHSYESKYMHIESTLNHYDTLTVRSLLSRVKGDVHQYTYLKFKVRVALGANRIGNFSVARIVSLHMFVAQPNSVPNPVQNQQVVWRYVLPIVCVILGAVLTLIGIYTYKQVLYKRRYRQYMRTHYETDSEAVSVSNENYDFEQNDLQLSFGAGVDHRDDENLVIA